ncbi:serine/threonine protein kinase [Desulfurococcus mucosus]|uniref:Ser/Thr protein kinase-like protein n=1 Tax=Desulfurococcus mucosus (strain ATCC 35584 / DSM 2162 / JCM 9187 / O7/1) TaxID=765177 RepID=E8R8R5_DESM0|nr:serine/threonine protein kinase [Desulfurococcus mucosus]ADV64891.1 Ser/Thr protein kinase-like protein [Desulfurococcus mucosus DSM 2162]
MGLGIRIEDAFMDGEVHFLARGLNDPYTRRILCFPSDCEGSLLAERVDRLMRDGFIYLLETGSVIHGVRVLGKGYSSIVVAAYHRRHGLGVLKLRRLDSRRDDLSREAESMMKAGGSGVVPELYTYSRDYIFRELIDPLRCRPVEDVLAELSEAGRIKELKKLLRMVFTALWRLDSTRVDHGELNRPGDHVFICRDSVKIIDWESARVSEKPGNLSSFASFILYRFKHSGRILQELGVDRGRARVELKRYKENYSEDSLHRFLEAMGLNTG